MYPRIDLIMQNPKAELLAETDNLTIMVVDFSNLLLIVKRKTEQNRKEIDFRNTVKKGESPDV